MIQERNVEYVEKKTFLRKLENQKSEFVFKQWNQYQIMQSMNRVYEIDKKKWLFLKDAK
jgi:hypothetical protein